MIAWLEQLAARIADSAARCTSCRAGLHCAGHWMAPGCTCLCTGTTR